MSDSRFIKSSYSEADGECVEVAAGAPVGVMVRDSKDVDAGLVRVRPEVWGAFLGHVKDAHRD
ncbi:DUF397 domain-containing protein [Streptomyces avicenniae]|uniref:DUF397 domain-containing protein n=1 Tax=Streptomyces avicenniae TaxID=500153 RepID=UPI00069BD91A|nr:DUF397 domain-containing protein [Streptomyces avicenniae]